MFIHLPFIFYQLFKNAKKQEKFGKNFWNHFFDEEDKKNISKKNWRRIHNYPFQFIVFFAELYADLREKPITDEERMIITLYGGGLCLYDDFFDEELLEEKYLKSIYFGEYINHHVVEVRLFQKIQQQFQANFSFTPSFTDAFIDFYEAQLKSKAQLKNILHFDNLKKIGFDKGGIGLVLSWLLLENNPTQKEYEFVYALGAWFQILDDILDMADDKKNNTQTLATDAKTIEDLESLLDQQSQIMRKLLKKLPYPPKKIRKFLRFLQVIGTSGKVQLYKLKQIRKNKEKNKQDTSLKNFSIEDLAWKQNDKKNFWIACKFWWKEE